MALSVASHVGWPIECWDVSTAFLYARLFADRDTDLGGNEIFMRPPKILVETKVVEEGVVWNIDCHSWESNPFQGEVSPSLFPDIRVVLSNVRWVIL